MILEREREKERRSERQPETGKEDGRRLAKKKGAQQPYLRRRGREVPKSFGIELDIQNNRIKQPVWSRNGVFKSIFLWQHVNLIR